MKFDHLSTLCVGLDIGSRGNFITALNFDSDRPINMRPVPNNTSGVEAMESMILAVLEGNLQFRYLLIAMESTSFYGVHVANYLSTSDQLKPYDVKVFCLNPKTIANYRKSFTGLGKNDGIDSFIVADYVRAGLIEIEPLARIPVSRPAASHKVAQAYQRSHCQREKLCLEQHLSQVQRVCSPQRRGKPCFQQIQCYC